MYHLGSSCIKVIILYHLGAFGINVHYHRVTFVPSIAVNIFSGQTLTMRNNKSKNLMSLIDDIFMVHRIQVPLLVFWLRFFSVRTCDTLRLCIFEVKYCNAVSAFIASYVMFENINGNATGKHGNAARRSTHSTTSNFHTSSFFGEFLIAEFIPNPMSPKPPITSKGLLFVVLDGALRQLKQGP